MRKFLLLFLSVLLFSCTGSKKPKVLSDAEKLMEDNPDSALKILNNSEKSAQTYKESYKEEYLLLKATAMNKAFVSMDTVTFMQSVLSYYKKHGSPDDVVNAYYNTGCVYRDKGDSPMALKYFLDAVEIANNDEPDYRLIARIYGQIASLYHEQRIPQKELEAWKKCNYYAQKSKDTIESIQAIELSSGAFSLLGEKDSALYVVKKAHAAYIRIGKKAFAAASLSPIIDYYLDIDSLGKAKPLIVEYIRNSGFFDKAGNLAEGHEFFYYYLGKYYEMSLKLDSAVIYYHKLISKASDVNSLENGYRGLMNVYNKLGKADSVFKYSNLFADANDSANAVNSSVEINRMQALYNYNESQQQARVKSHETDRLRLIVLCLIIFILFSTFTILHFVNMNRRKKKSKMLEINSRYSDILLQYLKATEERRSLKHSVEEIRKNKDAEILKLKEALSAFLENTNESNWDTEHLLIDNEEVSRFH